MALQVVEGVLRAATRGRKRTSVSNQHRQMTLWCSATQVCRTGRHCTRRPQPAYWRCMNLR